MPSMDGTELSMDIHGRSRTASANPSVYCPDLMRLIGHIRDTVQADLSARLA